MSTFLFAAHPASGHLNPLLAIARELREAGHTVAFAVSAPHGAADAIAAAGFRRADVQPSLRLLGLLVLPLTSGFTETCMALTLLSRAVTHYAREIGRVIDEIRPDAVVVDFSFPGAHLAAEWRGVPYAAVYVAGLGFPGPGIPPFGSGLPIGADALAARRYRFALDHLERLIARTTARARRRLGLPDAPVRSFVSVPASPWLNLALTAEACEPPRAALPDTTFFVGPCLAAAAAGSPDFEMARLDAARPKIYVSLGTVFNNRPSAFRRIIDTFADGRHQLIVSAGRAFARLAAAGVPSHVLLAAHLPQLALLPRVDVVISHGGNNTVNETLWAGKPLLVMPVGGEQADNASRVVYLGAGLRADLRRAGPDEIRSKIDRLLGEPAFRQRAETIARALAETDGTRTARRLLERLAATRTPLRRPPGYPLTLTRSMPLPQRPE